METTRNKQLYQFKVTLRDISPQIWRRIQIWEDCTLGQFHRVLQAAMGWENCHLYEFRIGREKYRDPDPENEAHILNAKRTQLARVLSEVGATFEYLYDFGDSWQHDVLVEAILPPTQDGPYPRCIGGERSCPPEDVGGPQGYGDYLTALGDPNHTEHEDATAWRGPFNPEDFSIEKVNRQLRQAFRLKI